MAKERNDIPANIKREVRKRCYYGCVLCGIPVFEYDHIEEYNKVKEHKAENITLLCATHHGQKTGGSLSVEVIKKYNDNPHNQNQAFTECHWPCGIFTSDEPTTITVGGNRFTFYFSNNTTPFNAVRIRGKTVIGIQNEEGNMLLNLSMADKDGNEILRIQQGELEVSTGVWDYQYEGKEMRIRSQPRNIEFKMSFMKNGVEVSRGYFSNPPYALEILPDRCNVLLNNNMVYFFKNTAYTGWQTGINVE